MHRMKNSRFRPALLLIVCWMAALACVRADSSLELSMKQMKKAYKELAANLDKPQEADKGNYLTLAETLKSSAQKARDLVPEAAEELPADKKAAMVKSYRESMDDLIAAIDSLIQNIQAAKWDEARKDISALKSDMKDGHREFRKED